jgi:5-formyltetrahydrofolate cyclo-ligase
MVVPPLYEIGALFVLTEKVEMRRHFRRVREEFVKSLSNQDLTAAFSNAPSALKSLFALDRTVAAYAAIGSEVNPMALLEIARQHGCKTALPHVVSKIAPMRFLKWAPGDILDDGPFGLIQPLASNAVMIPDIVFVPLVAFDRSLARLGQGAGHYDRALSILDNVTAIGIAWSVQECNKLPIDPWDVPLDAVLTEKEWICR